VSVGDEGPYMETDGPNVWVPRTVPYLRARKVAAEVGVESWQRLRYVGKEDADLLGFTRDCFCEEVCELRYRDEEDTGDRTCHVPAWHFEIVEP
jgi:hypothetical protein